MASSVAAGLVIAGGALGGRSSPAHLEAVAAGTDLPQVDSGGEVLMRAEPAGDGVTVTWSPVRNASGYDLYRSVGPDGSTGGWIRVNDEPVTASSLRDVGLPAGLQLTYSVKPRFAGVAGATNITLRRPGGLPTITSRSADPLSSYRTLLDAECPAPSAVAGTRVSTASELTRALAGARPGGVVRLADGVYEGHFRISTSASTGQPFWLCGGPGAVLQTGSTGEGTALRVESSSGVGISGFSVRRSLQGVMVKHSKDVVVRDLSVGDTGYEGIHVYAFSSDVLVRDNTIERTGSKDVAFGEGVYIGTSDRRWGEVTGGQPDATSRVAVIDNTVVDAGAEPIEAKMGTTDGLIMGNTIRGHQPGSRAIGWVLVTGNDWLVKGNRGSGAVTNGYVLMRQGTEYGHDNVVAGNTGVLDAPGWGVLLHHAGSPPPQGALVGCDNLITSVGAGVISGACQN